VELDEVFLVIMLLRASRHDVMGSKIIKLILFEKFGHFFGHVDVVILKLLKNPLVDRLFLMTVRISRILS